METHVVQCHQCKYQNECSISKGLFWYCADGVAISNKKEENFYDKLNDWLKDYYHDTIPEYCAACPNHPSNGGTGICNCILGSTWISR